MIDAFVRHMINRYGIDEVLSWYFEFWNEPELMGIFWDGDINTENKITESLIGRAFESNFDFIKLDDIDISLGSHDFLQTSVQDLISFTGELKFSKAEYFITEWDSNTDCRDLVHDTCFMAAFIVKNILLEQIGAGYF